MRPERCIHPLNIQAALGVLAGLSCMHAASVRLLFGKLLAGRTHVFAWQLAA
jgi:hypothetical protein